MQFVNLAHQRQIAGKDRPGQVIHAAPADPRTFACRLTGKSSFRSIIALRSAKVRLSRALRTKISSISRL
jgi:hypothetical protein